MTALEQFKAMLEEVEHTEKTNTRNASTDWRCRNFFVEYGTEFLSTFAAEKARADEAEEILRVVCHHLEIPQSASGPCDDLRAYDKALQAADFYTKQADADLAENRKARFSAEAKLGTAEATIASLTAKLEEAEAKEAENWKEYLEERSARYAAQAEHIAMRDTITSLTEQLAEAREALEPFARWKIADGLPNGLLRTPDQHPILIGTEHLVVAGDFRRASATLSRLEKQEGEA